MRERLHVGLSQKTGQGFAIGGHARGVGFRHNFELGIGEEDGADMLRLAELIEDQTGSYFGEDDIIRIEDDYRRA